MSFQASAMATEMLTIPTQYSNTSSSSVPFQSSTLAGFPGQLSAVNTATATADAKPSGYVAKEDWIKYRTLIAQLYEEQSLADVMEYMETRHRFRATTKMYKMHIKKYGLDKKSKDHEMRAVVRKHQQRAAQGKQSVFRVRGRIVDYENVIRYWKRKGVLIEESIAQPRQCATPEALECITPAPSPMIAPKELAIPEWIFASIRNYYKGSFESGTWINIGPEFECSTVKAQISASTQAYELTNSCVIVCALFADHAFQEAGRVLISASARIRDILVTEHPTTLSNLFRLIIYVRRQQRHEIALAILRQYSALGEVVLGKEHPLRRICGWLASVDSCQSEEVLSTCLRCIIDHFESFIGPMHISTLQSRTHYIRQMYREADIGRTGPLLWNLSNECEFALGPSDVRTLEVRTELAYYYLGQREYHVKVERLSLEIITRAQHFRSRNDRIFFRAEALWLLGNCQYARGDMNSGESSIRAAIDLRASEWGEDDSLVRLWRLRAEHLQRDSIQSTYLTIATV